MGRLRVVLVEDGTFSHGSLREALQSLDVDVVAEGSEWSALADQADARSADAYIVVAGNDPRVVYEMAPGDRAAMVVTAEVTDVATAAAVERGASAFAAYPLDGPLFHAQLRAAVARACDAAKARTEAASLRDQLDTRKAVERAKGILMDRLGLSEHDAFRKLQKASQDENRKMRDIAESVIRAEKMFAGAEEPAPRQLEHARRRPAS
jgi:AmiR/NasT family two-component response regulator